MLKLKERNFKVLKFAQMLQDPAKKNDDKFKIQISE
jgi:hypothetical protein